jgi:hypothetical protein
MLPLNPLTQPLQRSRISKIALIKMHPLQPLQLSRKSNNINNHHPCILLKRLHHLIPEPATPPRNQHNLLPRGPKCPFRPVAAQAPVVPGEAVEGVV